MKFVVQLEIVCLIVNFQLVKNQITYYSNGTIYVNHGDLTTTADQPIHVAQQNEHSKDNQHHQGKPTKNYAAEHGDHYTFVALIEVMFNDGSRRNCTGAIIHDNVVITAAHCFEKEHSDTLQIELTGSFVIIGTKEMFDSGYEQYLPIERVLIHPDYKGWKSDIALVYTFAGMMSDKPGNIIPLAEENSFSSINSNVTVLNWNQIRRKGPIKNIKTYLLSCSRSSEEKETYFHKGITRPVFSKINDWSGEDTKSSTSKSSAYTESILFMEDYTIIEINLCKHLVQKTKPAAYQIENVNSTLCYFTKNVNKAQANAGAPAVHRNHLVAIAAGDLSNEDEHIIIATKLSCYCKWISENLPTGGDQLQCCIDCCNESHFKSVQQIYY